MAVRREQVVKTAEKYVARGKIEAAIKEYRKVLDDQPNDSNTLNRVGDLYARIERIPEAIELFSQIATNYTDDGFFVKAIAIYKKIIKLDPTLLEIYEKLAELYHRQGLINEARSQYQVLADYYTKHENVASALSIYERMAKLEPDNPSHRVKLAELYQQQQLTDKAMGEYRRIAELMITHRSLDEAEKVYERALDVDASDLDFVAEAVDRLRVAGDEGAAGRLLAVAARKNPEARRLAQRPAPAVAAEPAEASPPQASPPAATEPAAESHAASEPEPTVPLAADAQEAVAAAAAAVADADGLAVAPPADEADLVIDLDVDELDEVRSATEAPGPAEAQPPAAAPPPPPVAGRAVGDTGEIEIDLDDVFVLDLEEEVAPESQVRPPEDIEAEPSFRQRHAGRTPPPVEEPPPAQAPAASAAAAADGGPKPFTLGPDPEEAALVTPPAEAPAAEVVPPSLDEGVFELDEPEPVTASPALRDGDGATPIDADFLERTAAELLPPERQAEDLLTEAEVFAKYGLEEKAADRLQEALKLAPRHLEAMSLLIQLYLDRGQHTRVVSVANQMARTAAETGDDQAWHKIRRRLGGAGYRFDGDRVTAAPSRRGETERAVGRMLAGLLEETPPAAAGKAPPSRADEELAELASEAVARTSPEATPEQPPAEAVAPEEAAELDESGTEWLSQVGEAAATVGAGADAALDEEEDFFDLAAEIEQELDAEQAEEDLLAQPREQTLEEIVEGFKEGVAENLSPEDYDTHFNLGIAYREMSLLDEAIGEFQLAAKAPDRLVECCSMLGLCFLDKGLPELAIKWYQRGLASETLSEDDQLGLLYDLGNVYLTLGEIDQARSVFVDIYGTNSHYRDIVAKLEEISARQ